MRMRRFSSKAFCAVMLMLEVSTECIHGSCALDIQLSESGVMAWFELVPGNVCHGKDANLEAVVSDCEHHEKS